MVTMMAMMAMMAMTVMTAMTAMTLTTRVAMTCFFYEEKEVMMPLKRMIMMAMMDVKRRRWR